ncbi:hypothetical protein K3495_g7664 [Podosphaera aphanis]|nr:hypothetical protein K3495_g7664 [Podosphaera aphanis]
MASWNCWRCLIRLNSSQLNPRYPILRLPFLSPFSTTTRYAAADRGGPPKKGSNSLRIAKANPIKDKGKPPATGERKAIRKRIVLSNNNALEVEMPEFNANMLEALLPSTKRKESKMHEKKLPEVKGKSPSKHNHKKKQTQDKMDVVQGSQSSDKKLLKEADILGKVVRLKDEVIDSLRAADAFKITQGWELFRHPAILIRAESKILSQKLVEAEQEKQTLRMVIDGARGSGKSMMLLHAMTTALVEKWLVINLPEAREITNAVTEYAPIPNSDLWTQNTLSAELLGKIAKTNAHLLGEMKVNKTHTNLPNLPSNISLYRLCELGAREPEVAWPFFLAFWSEITAENKPPIMMCLDGLTYILRQSLYRYPDLSFIHAQDLAIVRHFTNYLSGAESLPNGGAFIGATSRSSDPASKTLDLVVKRAEERAKGLPETKNDPYEKKYDKRSEDMLASVEIMNLKGMSKDETRSMMEYWAKSGVLRSRVDTALVAEKWALAGHGNPGEVQRGSIWMDI